MKGKILISIVVLFSVLTCFFMAGRQYGYEEGYDIGKERGYFNGHITGKVEGYDKGVASGKAIEHDRIINMKTISENCTPQEAIDRLARARESHRRQSESDNISLRMFGINCMQSYDRIANLIRELAKQ